AGLSCGSVPGRPSPFPRARFIERGPSAGRSICASKNSPRARCSSIRRACMVLEARDIAGGTVIGLGATLGIDLWALLLRRGFNIPSLSYCLLGRWLLHMPGGTFVHESIAAATQKQHECTMGWVAHYLIGTGFAIVFVSLA